MNSLSAEDLLLIIGELYVRNAALQREVATLKAALVQSQQPKEDEETPEG